VVAHEKPVDVFSGSRVPALGLLDVHAPILRPLVLLRVSCVRTELFDGRSAEGACSHRSAPRETSGESGRRGALPARYQS
jgi:hypothetical protein